MFGPKKQKMRRTRREIQRKREIEVKKEERLKRGREREREEREEKKREERVEREQRDRDSARQRRERDKETEKDSGSSFPYRTERLTNRDTFAEQRVLPKGPNKGRSIFISFYLVVPRRVSQLDRSQTTETHQQIDFLI
jgi:hypothetical protein